MNAAVSIFFGYGLRHVARGHLVGHRYILPESILLAVAGAFVFEGLNQ